MKLSPILLPLVGLTGALADCNANNCLRQIRGTAKVLTPDLASRMTDCSSYMLVTVTPATSTSTVSATATVTVGQPEKRAEHQMAARQVTVSPSSKPEYATACPDASAYSSACSCLGITLTTSTAPTPVVTVTATVATVTVCSAGLTMCGGSCKSLQGDSNNCGACGNACPSSHSCNNGICDAYLSCSYNSANQDIAGRGGCASNCYCDLDNDGFGACDQYTLSLFTCQHDSDCGAGFTCVRYPTGQTYCSLRCSGSNVPKMRQARGAVRGLDEKNLVRSPVCRIEGGC
ncbi:hypothetical protein GQ53DRAFT_828982 [Thozetella sp. PMI_491]|nr:hypothetical protein GQ53DRAFT_828982 [Thozetella sp. PMI_491]